MIAAAALAVGLFGSAQAAQADIIAPGTPADGARSTETQSDIIAILKADSAGNRRTRCCPCARPAAIRSSRSRAGCGLSRSHARWARAARGRR